MPFALTPLRLCRLLCWLVAAFLPVAAQAQLAVIGILEGRATLLRPGGKFELAEGSALNAADIVETAPAGFVQIEFADGLRLALGESSRLMLAPPAAAAAAPRARLLQGWMKLTPGTDSKRSGGDFATPLGGIGAIAGACVVHAEANQFELFVESGAVGFTDRGGAARQLKGSDFIASSGAAGLAAPARLAPDFVQRMPRLFRDALPARAAKFRDRPVAPRALGRVGYDDVAPWLQAEEGIRVPLIDTWRALLADKEFHAAVLANLARHPEWSALVLPPPKKRVPRPLPAPLPILPAASAPAR